MEIIKRGQLPDDKTGTGTCYHCGTIVRARMGECEKQSSYRGIMWSIQCPVCPYKICIVKFQ